ncbi:hypothetical protein K458DRAFT_83955 [Lentithecium fluviatile CBS 122367]|uniref:Uncharacterized protein n=1 Tax=Lentithecium fluviatile CBS 122367 TaxID=1168545 RepID=A0A6G1IU21_9PLEO|nr:hypothetical protein K458DRAFT_83955 [Lentithecium fluviatile CBS 122367]
MARLQGTNLRRADRTLRHKDAGTSSSSDLHGSRDEGHSIQPETAISRIEETASTQIPSTPVQAFGPNRDRGKSSHQRSPDGGVCLLPHDVSKAPTFAAPWSPSNTLCFSSTSANIGRRRSQRASMLLRSPARPGHASRMKQMFDEAGIGNMPSRDDEVVLYPQLPNVSRVASPLVRDHRCPPVPKDAPGSHLPPNDPHSAVAAIGHVNVTSIPTSDSSSGSWSDDSGYIALERARPLAGSGSPAHRIEDWLSALSHDDQEVDEEPSQKPAQRSEPEVSHQQANLQPITLEDKTRKPSFTLHLPSRQKVEPEFVWEGDVFLHDPFISRNSGRASTGRSTIAESCDRPPPSPRRYRHISDTCKRLFFDLPRPVTTNRSVLPPSTPKALGRVLSDSSVDAEDGEGGIELSPLSPNVCIERGPSRYHSAHNSQRNKSPMKSLTMTAFFTPPRHSSEQSKENAGAIESPLRNARTVRTLGSARGGIRFRCPPSRPCCLGER